MKKFFTFIAVAAMAFAAQADEITVSDGGGYNANLPIYGYYVDAEGTLGQMIYPATMLNPVKDAKITGVKFYADGTIGAEGAALQMSLMEVDAVGFETATAMTGATVVAQGVSLTKGAAELEFVFDTPYEYKGGNLLVEVLVTEAGTYGSTYFQGTTTEYFPSFYHYYWWYDNNYRSQFLPKATFTYEAAQAPVEPTVKTGAPTFHGYTEDGIHAYFVEIIPTEPSVIYYRVQYPDGTWTEWAEYEEILSFTGDGKYRVEAYAIADGKLKSEDIAYEFVVAPLTGIEEMNADKQVAGVRYFNMAGQEMQQAEGLTIVVTTYTDGTTSAVKVVK